MTREWKTRRISVIKSTTKGKKDRIELAATENAKVCTSVRKRYFTVETTIPEELARRGRWGRMGAVSGPGFTALLIGSGIGGQPNPIKGLAYFRGFPWKRKFGSLDESFLALR
jgi:hypothetical protein